MENVGKKNYFSWKPARKGNCTCATHIQKNDFASFHLYNAGFAKNALSVQFGTRWFDQIQPWCSIENFNTDLQIEFDSLSFDIFNATSTNINAVGYLINFILQ